MNITNELCGVILVNKHKGVTSHDIVFKIRKLYKTKKVGHTGTLDPLATGVLPVLIGRGAKAAEYLLSENKAYKAQIQLGVTTDTEDITGNILSKSDTLPTKNQFFEAVKHFVGEIQQVPPMYSALKVDGKKLVDLAREGIAVERQARKITIYSIKADCVDESKGIYTLEVECSKGTYIRTLCADIGVYLGCGAAMSELERTKSGNFTLNNAYTIDQIEKMSVEEREKLVQPIEELFMEAPSVTLSDFYSKLCHSGCEIYQKKIKTDYPVDEFIRICDKDGFFALGQVKDYPDGTAIKALKLFKL
ncbi:MAG: tRNA pseudouridine(55) synthase TruB [Clostridia bacterium]|nr:tRNA pseudouridine(55) synthase TruB [Clostridia bacterium]